MTAPALTGELLDRLRRRVTAGTAATHTSTAVFTGGELATLPESTVADVHTAVERAASAQREWAGTGLAERLAVFTRFHDLLLARQRAVLDLIQAETGKARRDAFEELSDVAMAASYYARTAARHSAPDTGAGARCPAPDRAPSCATRRASSASSRPWNYPLTLARRRRSSPPSWPATPWCSSRTARPRSRALFGADLLDRGRPARGPAPGRARRRPGRRRRDRRARCDYIGFTGSTRTGRADRRAGRPRGSSAARWSSAARTRWWSSTTLTWSPRPRARSARASPTPASCASPSSGSTSHDSIFDAFAERVRRAGTGRCGSARPRLRRRHGLADRSRAQLEDGHRARRRRRRQGRRACSPAAGRAPTSGRTSTSRPCSPT